MSPISGRPAAFFDLDKTIIAKSSTLAFSRPFYEGGLINRRSVLRSGYAQFVYLVGGADHDQMERMRAYLSAQATGWDVQTVKDIVAETLHHIVDPLVYDEAVELIEQHHLAGHDVVIVSTSGAEVVEPIGEMLGADRVDRDQDGAGGRPLHRRDRVLRLRRRTRRRAMRGARRAPRATTSRRPSPTPTPSTDVPDARGRRAPARRQPRQGAAQDRGRTRLAGARLRQAGRAAQARAASRPARARWPRWRSARGSRRPVRSCCRRGGPDAPERRRRPRMRAAPSEKAPPLTHERSATRRAGPQTSPRECPETDCPQRRVGHRVGTGLMCGSGVVVPLYADRSPSGRPTGVSAPDLCESRAYASGLASTPRVTAAATCSSQA